MSERCFMRVIVHYPETEKGKRNLARMVAEVHAQLIIDKLKTCSFSEEQKRKMITVLQNMEHE